MANWHEEIVREIMKEKGTPRWKLDYAAAHLLGNCRPSPPATHKRPETVQKQKQSARRRAN